LFGVDVVCLVVVETIVLGVVYVVGLVVGFWLGIDEFVVNWVEDCCWYFYMLDVEW